MNLHEYPPPPAPPAFSGIFSRTFLLFLLGSLLFGLGARQLLSRSQEAGPRPVSPRGALGAEEQATIALFEAAHASVVYVESRTRRVNWLRREEDSAEGSGSGFVWDEQGHVVTNFHVVRSAASGIATSFVVRFHDGVAYPAEFVGASLDYDLAVLRVDVPRERLRPLPVGSSSDLRVGQKAYAIGNPYGLEQTLTSGVLSGLNRMIQSQSELAIHGVIQTDAAINPGNSGGPLLDSAGRLIGVNTAIATPSGANTGVGFAVPVDTVNRIVPRILTEGLVERAGLGINLDADYLARDAGLEGAVVRTVMRGGPASKAGMRGLSVDEDGEVQLGDVIVGIEDHPIRSEADIYQALEEYQAGDEIRVQVSRPTAGKRERVELRVRLFKLLPDPVR